MGIDLDPICVGSGLFSILMINSVAACRSKEPNHHFSGPAIVAMQVTLQEQDSLKGPLSIASSNNSGNEEIKRFDSSLCRLVERKIDSRLGNVIFEFGRGEGAG